MTRLRKTLVLIISLCSLSLVAFGGAGDELKEKNRIMSEYYRLAMESYYTGEYTAAIARWTEILKIDPEQSQATKLIKKARVKMTAKIRPLRQTVIKLASSGKYLRALAKNKELLALDPGNKRWIKLESKLEKISEIIPAEISRGKTQTLMRKSINSYLSEKDDPRLSVNASRYAWQLRPKHKGVKDLKEFMETEYKRVARSERIVAGMNIIEQKLRSALTNIYEGKYDKTILQCNDVLALDPRNTMALKRAGSAYYASGNKKKAKQSWRKAARINPKDPELRKFMRMK